MPFDWSVVVDAMPRLLRGAEVTLRISSAGFLLALALGLAGALARLSRAAVLRRLGRTYVDVIRGTPPLIQIFFIFFGMPQLGVDLDAVAAGIFALGIYNGAYLTEIFRAGIESIDRGQQEAARALGMGHLRMMREVVLPQTALRVLPPTTGQLTILIKGSALLSTIGVSELLRRGQQIASVNFKPLEVYLAVALVYLLMNSLLSQGSSHLDGWLRRSQGLGSVQGVSAHAGGL